MRLFSIAIFFFQTTLLTASYNKNDEYICARLPGRLGNQLFTIAAAVSCSIDNNIDVYFNGNKKTTVPQEIETNLKKIFPKIHLSHPPKECCKKLTRGRNFLGNYWSEKYFKHNAEEVISLFQPSDEILKDLSIRYKEILEHPCSVAIHIRTLIGEAKRWVSVRPLYGKEYVEEAMKKFPKNSLYVVFSDNIKWCKKHLTVLNNRVIFVEGDKYYNDFYLMSLCKHNIVSNSTFSWWAAYINQNPNKIVVAPKHFMYPDAPKRLGGDIWPPEWITIDTTCGR